MKNIFEISKQYERVIRIVRIRTKKGCVGRPCPVMFDSDIPWALPPLEFRGTRSLIA